MVMICRLLPVSKLPRHGRNRREGGRGGGGWHLIGGCVFSSTENSLTRVLSIMVFAFASITWPLPYHHATAAGVGRGTARAQEVSRVGGPYYRHWTSSRSTPYRRASHRGRRPRVWNRVAPKAFPKITTTTTTTATSSPRGLLGLRRRTGPTAIVAFRRTRTSDSKFWPLPLRWCRRARRARCTRQAPFALPPPLRRRRWRQIVLRPGNTHRRR
jgi:hypothetical protein